MEEHPNPPQIEVLLVEDNPGDVRLMMEALKDSEFPGNLSVVEDGVEALAFLRRQGEYARAPRPNLVFLDLNLPKMDGMEVLAEIKLEDQLRGIPVIVLTSSSSHDDVDLAYRLNANCFITKPNGMDGFVTMIKSIQYFWSSVYFWAPVAAPPAKMTAAAAPLARRRRDSSQGSQNGTR
jgi:two-component system response regulator